MRLATYISDDGLDQGLPGGQRIVVIISFQIQFGIHFQARKVPVETIVMSSELTELYLPIIDGYHTRPIYKGQWFDLGI